MKHLKSIGKRLLYPPVWVMTALAVISTAALLAVFLKKMETSPVSYVVYAISTYTLSVIVLACVKVFPRCYRNIKQKAYGNKFGNQYLTDAAYRTQFSLHLSLGINLLYVAVNLFTGIWYRSLWSITLAVYYIILAVMRFLLLRFTSKTGIGKDRVLEFRRSRLCGIILMSINMALSGVVVLIILQDKGFDYGEILIYVMALYTFYATIHSCVNIRRYRKYNSPVMSASKIINLTAALVSLLSLETAMLSQFATENSSPYFDQIMIGATGAGVSAIVLALSVYMIVNATVQIRKINKSQT